MKDGVTWHVSTSKVLNDAVESVVNKGGYASKSDFLRDAVRRRLGELGFFE